MEPATLLRARLQFAEVNFAIKLGKKGFVMKKPQHRKTPSKPAENATDPEMPIADVSLTEDKLAEDQLAVTGRDEEASSSGHRIEPIFDDEEGNAEKLIEEGLHGYMHRSKKAR